ncbi:putative siderophore export protein [Gordonia hirsuta DSM 44140 = NBRC 16056]|uniref:Multidrug efflux pump Tap n=1 Tax=Gordonia hirsuta DSM 44140 = NBRC 16056 TaxID=1121927 RepID=L7LF00_9ACTN|nr:MFS transporter [Gordonia hirsuta]GAC58628.1 putative siderophore export protein [Gordonia hirsuta DSM 44140 = NBRC 16056]
MTTPRRFLIDVTPLRISVEFRRVFVARAISLIGIGMLVVSVPVQMWDLTGSSFQVGAATAVTGVSTFAGMLLGGMAADRFDRRRLILVGRSAAALAFAGLALNAFGIFGGRPLVWVLYLLAGFDGLIGALSAAALMAAVPTLIPRRHLAAVGALSSLTVRLGTTVSPGLAGVLIGLGGVAWTYSVAAAMATLTVLILLGLPTMPPHAALADDVTADEVTPDDTAPTATPEPPGTDGRRAAPVAPPSMMVFFRQTPVVGAVMLLGVLTMLGAGLVALLPALVTERFGDQSGAVGYLMAATAAGALIATLTSGWIGAAARPGIVLLIATISAFGLIATLSLATALWTALLLLLIIGFLDAVGEVVRYMLIQQHTPGPLLGRVNGIWMAQEVAGVTVGSLAAGALGAVWAAPTAIGYYGLVLLAAALLAALGLGALRAVGRPRTDDQVPV